MNASGFNVTEEAITMSVHRPQIGLACIRVSCEQNVPADVLGSPRFFRLMTDGMERFFSSHETKYDLLPQTLADRRALLRHRADPDRFECARLADSTCPATPAAEPFGGHIASIWRVES